MRYTVATTLIMFSFISFGQISQGAKVIDLSFSYGESKNEILSQFNGVYSKYEVSSRLVNLNTSWGIAFSRNKIFHIGMSLSSSRSERPIFFSTQSETFVSTSNIYSIVVGYEQLFEIVENVYLSPFFSGSFGLGKKKETDSQGFDSDLTEFAIAVTPRMYYFIDDRWVLTGSIGFLEYRRSKEEVDIPNQEAVNLVNESLQSTFGLNSWMLGVRFIMNNSK